ncbi:MAG TPA: glyoxalase superfamily protein [Acidimicrobiales bacterium]|nr:glyoxalase superfamily protein [Acidimicrobiales bacterium]
MDVNFTRVVPILRIFDLDMARQFYLDYLGFKVDWEHRFDDAGPLYMPVSKSALVLHLSEHHGDGTSGSAVYVETRGVRAYHAELQEKDYPHLNPGCRQDRGVYDAARPFREHAEIQRTASRAQEEVNAVAAACARRDPSPNSAMGVPAQLDRSSGRKSCRLGSSAERELDRAACGRRLCSTGTLHRLVVRWRLAELHRSPMERPGGAPTHRSLRRSAEQRTPTG